MVGPTPTRGEPRQTPRWGRVARRSRCWNRRDRGWPKRSTSFRSERRYVKDRATRRTDAGAGDDAVADVGIRIAEKDKRFRRPEPGDRPGSPGQRQIVCVAGRMRTNRAYENEADLLGNRRFESISLQRRVQCEQSLGFADAVLDGLPALMM